MPGLVQVDTRAVLRRIAEACRRHPEVVAAYLFGSARDLMRPESDVDVGLVLAPDPSTPFTAAVSMQLEERLAGELDRFEDHPFDVTVLSLADPIFAVHVLNDAELAYVADPGDLAVFLERVALRHWRDASRYWAAIREVNGWDPHRSPNA